MEPKMFVKPAIRIGILAAVVIGILILFGVTWWVALLSVLLAVAAVGLTAWWWIKRQRRQFLERIKAFNITPESGKIHPADLRRMYNRGGQARKDAVNIYCMANNNCPEAEAHKAFKEMSVYNRAGQMKAMHEMQAAQRKGKGKGRGGIRG
ncbi:hypothetical protein V6667_05410 [Neisseria leonii]|uniref:Uncharacterized protein n=1 Tax=Neisseria leonii TaxID=2995413 RepID=A0A9X4E324_9NEIS|nr:MULTISPECIES: hypothetical protein [unclassified Neisseria]MDD9326414.1 hypothetical protein [Neisseria sp. 3986]MDD9328304.1 hypothetical protein [Neisseria sp. 51.81]